MNQYRVYYREGMHVDGHTDHEALRIDVGVHGTLVMWGHAGPAQKHRRRIIRAWPPGCWIHVELREDK